MPSYSLPSYHQKFVEVNFQMFAVNAILVNVEAAVEVDKSVLAAVGMVLSVAPTGMIILQCVL